MAIAILEREISDLRKLLQQKENQLLELKEAELKKQDASASLVSGVPRWAVERYSRQALVSWLGAPSRSLLSLMQGSALVVGAGGLGCPSAAYLAGAGIGHIGLVDYDVVELSNIHRQILHSELTVGLPKVDSAIMTLRRINSTIRLTPFNLQLDSTNALDVIRPFDVVIDATDNAVTRYLLNDACVILKKPLVSASALKMEGQFTVYNHLLPSGEGERGPCLRCVFPTPPPAHTVGSCSASGVLGPAVGLLGCLQALTAINILLNRPTCSGHLLLFDGTDTTFRKVKLRKRDPKCAVCSDSPSITALIDYPAFCNAQASDKELKLNLLKPDERIPAKEFSEKYINISSNETNEKSIDSDLENKDGLSKDWKRYGENNVVLLDVRSPAEFDMCHLRGSTNFDINRLENQSSKLAASIAENGIQEVFFICRRGNDSQLAVQYLKDQINCMQDLETVPVVKDIEGGLHQWSKTVDSDFPIY